MNTIRLFSVWEDPRSYPRCGGSVFYIQIKSNKIPVVAGKNVKNLKDIPEYGIFPLSRTFISLKILNRAVDYSLYEYSRVEVMELLCIYEHKVK